MTGLAGARGRTLQDARSVVSGCTDIARGRRRGYAGGYADQAVVTVLAVFGAFLAVACSVQGHVPLCGVAAIKAKLQVEPQAGSPRRNHCLTGRQVKAVVVTVIAAPVGPGFEEGCVNAGIAAPRAAMH
ncbi:hypothetical protein [Streptomyces sp. NPDC087787]|uniref:hypothetical protein n=1 Tax=Streptomyces sp. NPDC087787 TaxID=3365803 RepID=UPI00382DB0C8